VVLRLSRRRSQLLRFRGAHRAVEDPAAVSGDEDPTLRLQLEIEPWDARPGRGRSAGMEELLSRKGSLLATPEGPPHARRQQRRDARIRRRPRTVGVRLSGERGDRGPGSATQGRRIRSRHPGRRIRSGAWDHPIMRALGSSPVPRAGGWRAPRYGSSSTAAGTESSC